MKFLLFIVLISSQIFASSFEDRQVAFILESNKIKIHESAFVQKNESDVQIILPFTTLSFHKITFGKNICLLEDDHLKEPICEDELKFQKDYLEKTYYEGFLYQLFSAKPIFNGENLKKDEGCFSQDIESLKYRVCGDNVRFEDEKIRIIVNDLI